VDFKNKSIVMRKLMMKMSISVDGFISGTNGENDWIYKTGDEESKAYSVELGRTPGLLIMGRKSFEVMAPYWPTATGPFAAPMNEIARPSLGWAGAYEIQLCKESAVYFRWRSKGRWENDHKT
jgi:dihydrofolate reductase